MSYFKVLIFNDISLLVRRIILRWIFRKWDVGVWTGLSWLRIGTCGGYL
jgi:hypothetical protein